MSPNACDVESARKWMRYAQSDLQLACARRPDGVLWETLAFHAQQAAEKAFKAVLISYGVDFPPTHNLSVLRELLPTDIVVPTAVSEAVELTVYAVAVRYPDDSPDLDESDYRRAVKQARTVLDWASGKIC